MKLQKWFCDPVWMFEYNLDLSLLTEYAYDIAKQHESNQKSNRGGWQSPPITEFQGILEPLKNEINNSFKQAKKSYGIKDQYDLEIHHGWFNINPPGSWNIKHLHPHSIFSGTVYIKVPQGEPGCIQFYRNPIVLSYMEDYLIEDFNDMSSGTVSYTASENSCLIFPSWLEHQVTPNFTNEDRISFSFNTGNKVYDKQ